jgi:Holliday junction resolvase RusA-like endonuclease
MSVYTIVIPGWHPYRLNQTEGRHWSVKARLKRADREMIGMYARLGVGVPQATGKRRIGLTVTLAPKQRSPDPDAFWKGLLDSLVACRLLVDDNPKWVEILPVRYERGSAMATTIAIEDVES